MLQRRLQQQPGPARTPGPPSRLLRWRASKSARRRGRPQQCPQLAAATAAPQLDGPDAGAASASSEDALLLAYFASQNKSQFAAQCFVEAVLDAYTAGATVDALQAGLSLKSAALDGSLLQPQDSDLLLSWLILVVLTAREVGVPTSGSPQAAQPQPQQPQPQPQPQAGPGQGQGEASAAATEAAAAAEAVTLSHRREVLGLLQFVKQAARLYFDEGYSVTKLAALQSTVASDPEQGSSPFLQLMQQYTRLVIIALEVAAGAGLPTSRPLANEASLDAPSGFTAAFAPPWRQEQQLDEGQALAADTAAGASSSSSSSGSGSSSSGVGAGLVTTAALARGRGGVRARAVRLMTAFVGAVIGSPYSLRAFVLGALDAYEAGVPAAALFGQLTEAEFAQSGGLVPARPAPEVLIDVNRTLFGRWLSLTYMSAAQLGAVFPGAEGSAGWAWYGGEDEVQANAVATFVGTTLLRLQQEADEAAAEQQAAAAGRLDTAAPPEDPLLARIKSSPEAAAALESVNRDLQQELQERGTRGGKALPLMAKVPDPHLEASSGAVRLWKQQLQLVAAVRAVIVQLA